MDLSRDTFYRYKAAADEGGIEALFDRNRRSPNLKNRVDPELEKAVLEYALEQPANDQLRTSNGLRKLGTFISPSGVRSIWLRHGLACFKDRLKALSDKMAAESLILTEDQVALQWSAKSTMMKPVVRSKRNIQASLALRIRITLNAIEHTKTKVKSPQTNGICERFHKTILNEFYQIALRKKIYQSVDELQVDLDEWLGKYNTQRTHQGKVCQGRTPMDT